jgi:hypothetical protein
VNDAGSVVSGRPSKCANRNIIYGMSEGDLALRSIDCCVCRGVYNDVGAKLSDLPRYGLTVLDVHLGLGESSDGVPRWSGRHQL